MPLRIIRATPGVAVALLAAGGAAWWLTTNRMAGMDSSPGADLGALGWFTVTWLVMMAAMMLPSLAPTLSTYLTLSPSAAAGEWLVFVAGYLATWAAAGLAAFGIFKLGSSLVGDDLAWDAGGRYLAAGVLLAASVYELVPLKRLCLARCRGQFHKTAGGTGRLMQSLTMGIRSGGWCLGCSWLLMASLFALGVMSLTWMALVAALIALEKLGPWPTAARLLAAGALTALALGMILAAQDVPGLVVPHGDAMHTMGMMGS
jgi:predicted metal-binding membrane protein